ncbi:hypothetical protein NUW54_g104 [Trametes sanguinea]|uniref:Uncharacterized protein n=1 Tax=Trametes sanguinea TaxID=158606 RepID=A0ACC1QBK5_9APHY|nr:hypothetical protein NUW54_g104 [Trametes sanguinea]
MAFIRAPLSAVGCPRRGDPQRFTHLYNYHLGPTGRDSLARVTPPVITAAFAFDVPGVVAPWEFGQHLDTFLLGNATVTTNGRVRFGHGIFLFEDATDILPATGLPPPPGDLPPATAPAVLLPTPPQSRETTPNTPPDKPQSIVVNSILHADVALPRTESPPEARPLFAPDANGALGESESSSERQSSVDEGMQKLENVLTRFPETMRTVRVNGWTTVVSHPRIAVVQEIETDEEEDELQVGVEGDARPTENALPTPAPPTTPEDPSPNVSPLSTPPPVTEDEEIKVEAVPESLGGPYNLRPRPEPRKQYRESPPPRVPTRRIRRRGVGVRGPCRLALQGTERAGLEALLNVPAGSWSRGEKEFLKTVLRSLKRAVMGGVGYGEGAEKVSVRKRKVKWQVVESESEESAMEV